MPSTSNVEEQIAVANPTQNGKVINILPVAKAPPALGVNKGQVNLSVDVPVGPVNIKLRGPIDLSTQDCDIEAFVKLPVVPPLKVGQLTGNLKSGVTSEFKIAHVSGSLLLCIKEKQAWIRSKISFKGKSHEVDVGLIPLGSRTLKSQRY